MSRNPSFFSGRDAGRDAQYSTSAATRIQSAFRGYLARKKYRIQPTNNPVLEDVFVFGNDPTLTIHDEFISKEQFALIGTSGLRALSIATYLCDEHTDFIPKIFIIDHNQNVKKFWEIIIDAFYKKKSMGGVFNYIAHHQENEVIADNSRGILSFLDDLQKHVGFYRLKKIVCNTALIVGNWQDKNLFVKIKNVCDQLEISRIYVYASNILTCMDIGNDLLFENDPLIAQVLQNIKSLNPFASIHSDLSIHSQHCLPQSIFMWRGTGDTEILKNNLSAIKCFLKVGMGKLELIVNNWMNSRNFENADKFLEDKKNLFSLISDHQQKFTDAEKEILLDICECYADICSYFLKNMKIILCKKVREKITCKYEIDLINKFSSYEKFFQDNSAQWQPACDAIPQLAAPA